MRFIGIYSIKTYIAVQIHKVRAFFLDYDIYNREITSLKRSRIRIAQKTREPKARQKSSNSKV